MKNNLNWLLLTLVAAILYSCSAEQDAIGPPLPRESFRVVYTIFNKIYEQEL